jgi:histone H3/H4
MLLAKMDARTMRLRSPKKAYPEKIGKNGEWKRLSEKAGITKISGYCYPYLEDVCHKFITTVLNKALIYMEYANRKTIYFTDINQSLEITGYSKILVSFKKDVKKCKIPDAKRVLTRIRSYQQQSDCFMFAKIPFQEFIRGEIEKSKIPARSSQNALIMLQHALESFALSILMAAANAMAHAKRSTLFVEDLELVVNNLSSNCAKILLK